MGCGTTSASAVRGCRTMVAAPELMNYFFSSFSLRVILTYSCVLVVKAILLLSCPTIAKGRGALPTFTSFSLSDRPHGKTPVGSDGASATTCEGARKPHVHNVRPYCYRVCIDDVVG